MKRSIFTAGLALATVTLMGFAAPAVAGETATFKGTLAGSFTVTTDLPPENNRFLVAAGQATQLGNYTFDFPHSVDRSTIPATGVGIATFTAANGDQIFALINGEAVLFEPGILLGTEHGTILGGTGRFENATGSFVITRLIDTVNLTTIGGFQGTVNTVSK